MVGVHFDVVRADGGLDFVRIVEAFDVGEVGDVEGGGFRVAWDKFHILDTASIRNGDRADDSPRSQIPKSERVGVLDTERWLQDGDRDHEVRHSCPSQR